MQTIYFILDGQELKKALGFPKVVEKSSNYLKAFIRGIPEGYTCTAYFSLSWENKKVYSLPVSGNECIIDEYITTLPSDVSDYYDYKVYMSIAGTNENGSRFTSSTVDFILDKTTYSSITENTPEIPQSQYESFVQSVAESANKAEQSVYAAEAAKQSCFDLQESAAAAVSQAAEQASNAMQYATNAETYADAASDAWARAADASTTAERHASDAANSVADLEAVKTEIINAVLNEIVDGDEVSY